MPLLNKTVNKCALLIGICYNGSDNQLRGCINDTKNLKDFLINSCGYKNDEILLLTDDTENKPTKDNILKYIELFVNYINNNNVKEAWFSYSGHGHFVESSEESDSKDECFVPLDYSENGGVTDNMLYTKLIKNIPLTCSLFSIIDACHSGTSLDLPYVYRFDKGIVQQKPPELLANIIKISGCRDHQTSMDSYINGSFQGALTACFLKSVKDLEYNFTCFQLIRQIKSYIYGGNYKQIPTLSFSNEELLHNTVMGSANPVFNNCNVELCLEGDDWCDQETEWNIYHLEKNKRLFENNLKFYKRNEKVKIQLNLENGRQLLTLSDAYGDGGLTSGYLKYLNNHKIIKEFDFTDGFNKSIDFTINDKDSRVIDDTEYLVKINVVGDKYSAYETSWNILNLDGTPVFKEDKNFSDNSKYTVELKLKAGEYKIKCMDDWGDGGMSGKVLHAGKEIMSFNFNKNKLNFYNFFLNSVYNEHHD